MFIFSNEIMQGIRQGKYKYIGDGSGRVVFDMKNGYVVKVAKNMAGIAQNKAEYKISKNDKSRIFAEVVQASDDYYFIIMKKAEKVNNMYYVWLYFNAWNERDFLRRYEIQEVRNKYNLLLGDLKKKSSWGIVDGKAVIIDYGFTKEVRDKYY